MNQAEWMIVSSYLDIDNPDCYYVECTVKFVAGTWIFVMAFNDYLVCNVVVAFFCYYSNVTKNQVNSFYVLNLMKNDRTKRNEIAVNN